MDTRRILIYSILGVLLLPILWVRADVWWYHTPAIPPPAVSPGMDMRDEKIPLFVYGTLTNPIVRFLVYGKVTPGTPTILSDYSRQGLTIVHETNTTVEGLLLYVTPTELHTIDRFEDVGHTYNRVPVSLQGEQVAWTYIRNIN